MKRINDLNCFHAIMMMRPQPFILQYRISVFIALLIKKYGWIQKQMARSILKQKQI